MFLEDGLHEGVDGEAELGFGDLDVGAEVRHEVLKDDAVATGEEGEDALDVVLFVL